MGFTKSPIAYDDIRPVLDQALESEKGLRLTFEREYEAWRWQSRANHFRQFQRGVWKDLHPEEKIAQSEYDRLVIRRPQPIPESTDWFVEILKGMPLPKEIQELI